MQAAQTTPLQTSDELAAFFKVSVRTIRDWHRRGRLRGVRIGRQLRFRQSDVDAIIRAQLDREPLEAA